MKLELPYGANALTLDLGADPVVQMLNMGDVAPLRDPAADVRDGLARPIGMEAPFLDGFRSGESVCIIVPDSFRQSRVDLVLPMLISALNERGIDDESIALLFATGVHRAPTSDEHREILGDAIAERFGARLVNHNAHDASAMRFVGTTSRGTQVEVNRLVCESDHAIATGAVVLHYFGGFGGGRKCVVPGVASARTIAQNHALNLHPTDDYLDPRVRIGVMAGNPVAEDMLEATRFVHVDGIVNTVLNRAGEIAGLYVGELEAAHEAACAFARAVFTVACDSPADIVVAASPSTRNYVQTHKALYNASSAGTTEARIVLAAPCVEGLGAESFTKWLALGDTTAIIRELRRNSEINGQTALSTIEKAARTYFVTEMTEDDVRRLGGTKCTTIQEAYDRAMAGWNARGDGRAPRVIVMPSAAYTVPICDVGALASG